MPIDEQTLVRYVDGELDQATVGAVEAALAVDPELARTVRDLRQGAAMMRAAYADPMRTEVPARLIQTVESECAAQRHPAGPSAWRTRPLLAALAASFAILVVGLGGAMIYTERQVEQRLARLEAAREGDRALIQSTIATVLENHLSGVPAAWHNPQTGSRGKVEPIRTFRNANGQWCREYILNAELVLDARDREVRRAVACREGEGQWRTRLEMASES